MTEMRVRDLNHADIPMLSPVRGLMLGARAFYLHWTAWLRLRVRRPAATSSKLAFEIHVNYQCAERT
ncbi:hypothetical protein AAFP35_25700 [Gordonia sp. CPCC 206044]|uniref:hypothetical protein n=1 Tax=Gordonia sp. CPCC 206044 TaxID=3140793 RepID=UPI003AF33FF1